MGNLRSVQKAFEHWGQKPLISSKVSEIEKADKIVLPGVGAFSQAMFELKKRKLVSALKEKIQSGTPYLGLCLGLQLLFSSSEEGREKGLGIFPGRVKKFSFRGGKLKVPHMGWNTISIKKENSPLFEHETAGDYFYFVHSFYAVPEEKNIVASTTNYGSDFCSAVWRDNIYATQFHPEKSQRAGLRLIGNFVKSC